MNDVALILQMCEIARTNRRRYNRIVRQINEYKRSLEAKERSKNLNDF